MKVILGVIGSALLFAACGNVEEAERPAPPPAAPAPVTQEPQRMTFVTKTDTVATEHGATKLRGAGSSRPQQIRYMVQIGAFKDPEFASRVQALARSRYHMPVLNDYFAKLGLYQIRLGFFVTREEAHDFRAKMLKEYPGEYKDSWVVHLKQ